MLLRAEKKPKPTEYVMWSKSADRAMDRRCNFEHIAKEKNRLRFDKAPWGACWCRFRAKRRA